MDRWERRAQKQEADRRRMRLHGASLRSVIPQAILKRAQQPVQRSAQKARGR